METVILLDRSKVLNAGVWGLRKRPQAAAQPPATWRTAPPRRGGGGGVALCSFFYILSTDTTKEPNVMPSKETSIRLNLRISRDIHARLDTIAQEIGMPKATIGAFVIGQYVENMDRQREIQKEARNIAAAKISEMLESPDKAAQLASAFQAAGMLSDDSSGRQMDIEDA